MNPKERINDALRNSDWEKLKDENRRLRRGIRRILEVRRLWGSVVNPDYRKILTEVFKLAEELKCSRYSQD